MRKISVIILALVFVLGYTLSTEDAISEQTQREYVGLKKCKMCHNNDKSGAQFKQWSQTKHAKSFETLGTSEAKEIAKKMGIEDPQKDGKCLKCHVTAYGVDTKFLGKDFKYEDGVTCESCHGAGGDYWKKSTMEQLSKGEIEPTSVGLVIPDENLCKTCHNQESPTYKEFKFDEMYQKISHPIPDDYKKSKGYK